MSSGIFSAILTSLVNGTTANAPDVMTDLNALKTNGVNNDSATITTDGSGNITLIGLITQALTNNITPTTLSGSTSGTVKLYPIIQGSCKLLLLRASNFRNGGGSAQTITLPQAFTDGSAMWTFDMPQWTLLSGGSSQNSVLYYYSSIDSGGLHVTSNPGSSTGNLLMHTGSGLVPFDTVQFAGGQSGATSGFLIILGI